MKPAPPQHPSARSALDAAPHPRRGGLGSSASPRGESTGRGNLECACPPHTQFRYSGSPRTHEDLWAQRKSLELGESALGNVKENCPFSFRVLLFPDVSPGTMRCL